MEATEDKPSKSKKSNKRVSLHESQKHIERIEDQLFPGDQGSNKKLPMIIEETDTHDMAKYKQEFNSMFEKFSLGMICYFDQS